MPPPKGSLNPNVLEGPGDYTTTPTIHSDTYPSISPLQSPGTHTQKSVFIAGASRGIGLATALSFALAGTPKIAIGARSPLSSVTTAILAATADASLPPPEILEVELDVTSQVSTEAAAALIEKEFGGLDILVINAGVLSGLSEIADSDPDAWWMNFEVNVKGPYLICRALLPVMVKGGGGMVVATSSVGAHLVGRGVSGYQSSKLAVLRLMEFVSVEYAGRGVVGFSIHPGNCATEMVGGKELSGIPENMQPIFVDTPELCGDTVVYLTREKRDWLAGRYVNVTWDMPELMAMEDEIVKEGKLKVRLVL